MNINISGHHVDITDSLRAFITSKFKRLQRHYDHLIESDVILHVEKIRHRAEARLHVSGNTLFAEAEESDMYKAIDGMVDKLDKQILKHKGKRTNHHAAQVRKDAPSQEPE